MRVLLTGATGLIGGSIVRALLRDGHDLVCAVRDPARLAAGPRCRGLAVDLSTVPDAAWWRPHLAGIDAVVNAVGILREQGGQAFDALHARAPAELFRACAASGVHCVVQVSALGADERGTRPYHTSKRAADDVLRGLPVAGAVVQPSLVYAPAGPSSQLFLQLASLPVLLFPLRGGMAVQPVHLDDVVEGVLAVLRAQIGLGRGPLVLPLPVPLFRFGAALAQHVPGSALDPDTAHMLLQGNAAPAGPFARLLGHPPKDVRTFVPATEAEPLRARAVLGWALPALRLALAALWIWTAIVSFGLYPVQQSYGLLARVGLHGALATVALYGAALLDLALGVLTLAAPARWRAPVWLAQLALVAGYTVLITFFLPEYWLHPYGPVSKNLPIMAAIALLWGLEPRTRR
jgi:uncharacterized protein YbjT (DUF2867 family)